MKIFKLLLILCIILSVFSLLYYLISTNVFVCKTNYTIDTETSTNEGKTIVTNTTRITRDPNCTDSINNLLPLL